MLVRGERAGLAQQLVDQGGFPVVDVGDDGDVPDSAHKPGSDALFRPHGAVQKGAIVAQIECYFVEFLGRSQ
jgi:hypothetical protein